LIRGFIANKPDVVYDEKKNIYYPVEEDAVLAKIEGEWSIYINIDGKQYWKQGEIVLPEMEKMEHTLPSDSRYRPDVILLRNNFEDYAQQAKTHLEEIQRNDEKLRNNYNKNFK
jgi:hypothetical protein